MEIEANWDKVKTVTLPTGAAASPAALAPLTSGLPLELRPAMEAFLQACYEVRQGFLGFGCGAFALRGMCWGPCGAVQCTQAIERGWDRTCVGHTRPSAEFAASSGGFWQACYALQRVRVEAALGMCLTCRSSCARQWLLCAA